MSQAKSEEGRARGNPASAELLRMLKMLARIKRELKFPETIERAHLASLLSTARITREKFLEMNDPDNVRIADLLISYLMMRIAEK